MFFKNKKILVAGGTGLVGQQLVPLLVKEGAKVYVASMDDKYLVPKKVVKFYNLNLMNLDNCIKVTKEKDIVFNLLGVTGSPKINNDKPGSFMMANLYCAINMLMAAKISKVKRYLYTSSNGVYAPAPIMKENTVWRTFPSENDKYAGWAKRIGELQIEAFKKEFNFESLHIVRPANIYGPYANFDPVNSMVVSSLIKRFFDNESPLIVWGDGMAKRDFVYSKDVAMAMIQVLKRNIQFLVNVGSGKGTSIKELVNIIFNSKFLIKKPKIIFDITKPSGDKKRILDVTLAKKNGIF
ncbi:NAD-dependent epimerase/dehydratase family protein, partial [bacterium]|nr:NAD-dependent epimerase/dehydratase family protein [Candidatus Elulimicrobium humile]